MRSALLILAALAATSMAKEAPKAAPTVKLDFGPEETDKSFLQASAKARFASALTARAHAHAQWRFGGNFAPQVSPARA